MSTPKEKQVFLEIIEMYKNLPILWDREHKGYKSKHKRNYANQILLEVYKKIDEDATTQTLTKKILNLRTSYFKELRKVKDSLADDGEIYEPTLWYFDAFSFLDDNTSYANESRSNESCNSDHKDYIKIESITSSSTDEERGCKNSEINSPVMRRGSDQNSDTVSPPPAFRRGGSGRNLETPPLKMRKFTNPIVYKNTNNSLELACEPSQMKNEEWDIFGKAIGLQLRDLDKKQLTIAQKIISDTIYYAKFGLLSQKTYINLGSPPP